MFRMWETLFSLASRRDDFDSKGCPKLRPKWKWPIFIIYNKIRHRIPSETFYFPSKMSSCITNMWLQKPAKESKVEVTVVNLEMCLKRKVFFFPLVSQSVRLFVALSLSLSLSIALFLFLSYKHTHANKWCHTESNFSSRDLCTAGGFRKCVWFISTTRREERMWKMSLFGMALHFFAFNRKKRQFQEQLQCYERKYQIKPGNFLLSDDVYWFLVLGIVLFGSFVVLFGQQWIRINNVKMFPTPLIMLFVHNITIIFSTISICHSVWKRTENIAFGK